MKIYSFFILIILAFLGCNNPEEKVLPKVTPIDLNKLDPQLFAEEEWFVPYYLAHFAKVANCLVDTGSTRGYFSLSVWRGTRNHHTYNAREMESILSLAWFYCTNQTWNVYYNNKALKKRIEAALEYWCNIQHEDGRFSEYGEENWSLAPTAFATKFVGRALWLLNKGPEIDKYTFERSKKALRKAIYIGLTNEKLWQHGRNYTNQFANLWGGALLYLNMWPDQEIETLLKQRMNQSMNEFQSPMGFFYEKGGPDWGYNLSTHHSDFQVAWEFADEEIKKMIVKKTKDWYIWFSYNAVKEPENPCFYLNRGIETRQQLGYYLNAEVKDPALQRWVPQAEFVPETHAFEMSKTEYEKSIGKKYREMLENYPHVAPLELGEFNAFSPYAFLHHNMKLWHPGDVQKKQAIEKLPYLENNNFVHLRHDGRSNSSVLFVRKPTYYATFNFGNIITEQQRYGLGLIWNPEMGTIFQSQSRTDIAAFGTKTAGDNLVAEADNLFPVLKQQYKTIQIEEGNIHLDTKPVELVYGLKNGKKIVVFEEDRIVVKIQNTGNFTEVLPLLVSPDDKFTVLKNQVTVQNEKGKCTILLKNASAAESVLFETDLYQKNCKVVNVSASDFLTYEIMFNHK